MLLLTALSFNASALDPRIRCGNFCWWNWQHICPIDNPNNLDYCSRGYLTCLQYWGQTPDDCAGGPGVGGEGPMVNCPIYVNLGEPGGQRDFGLTSAQTGVLRLNNASPDQTPGPSYVYSGASVLPNEDGRSRRVQPVRQSERLGHARHAGGFYDSTARYSAKTTIERALSWDRRTGG